MVASALDWASAISAGVAAWLWLQSARVHIPDMQITASGSTGPTLPAIHKSAKLSQRAAWAAAASAAFSACEKVLSILEAPLAAISSAIF